LRAARDNKSGVLDHVSQGPKLSQCFNRELGCDRWPFFDT
jgi:hypothetical protein